MRNGGLGFWQNGVDTGESDRLRSAPALETDLNVDVAIVGGGYSGLWTALAIATRSPELRVVVLEAETFGYGASGRNGGWLSAKPVGKRSVLARQGREHVIGVEQRLRTEMLRIPQLLGEAGHDIHAHHGGSLLIARSPSELARARTVVDAARAYGLGPDRTRVIDAGELADRVRVDGAVGAVWNADMIRIDPMRLLAGLCQLVDDAGVDRRAHSRVDRIEAGRLEVGGHVVTARDIVIATEGYTSALPGRGRDILPLNSTMIATRQLSDLEWDRIGWSNLEGISGAAHTYFYGQRTPDGRIILGGRGKPYRFRSGFDDDGHVDGATIRALHDLAATLFPTAEVTPEFAWCGVLGVTRDWTPHIDVDRGHRTITIAGYAGQGVTASKVGADAAAALLTGKGDEHRDMPWIRPAPRRWEPEPLRWIGANGLYRAYALADQLESLTSSPRTSIVAKIADVFAGR